MKIGIMTFHASYNCGSMLQAFALQQTLIRKYGADVQIINYSNWHQRNMYGLIDKRPNKMALKNNIDMFPYLRILQSSRKDYQNFLNNYFILTPKSYKWPSQLLGVEKDFDLLIAGGDQVWNVRCRDHDDAYYLNFAKDIRKVSYSPSLGAQNVNKIAKDSNIYREYLADFEKISVRERNGQKWIKELTDKEVSIVADPTLLLTKDEWLEWLPVEDIKGDYIFNYAFYHDRPETNKAIQKISKRTGMPVYTIDFKSWAIYKLSDYGIEKYEHSGPLAMLALMKNAKLVLTQSFHGTLFSALFKRKFWSYHNPVIINKNDDRATYLMSQLGISERYVTIDDLPERADLMDDIDFEPIEQKIIELRKKAFEYIDEFMIK